MIRYAVKGLGFSLVAIGVAWSIKVGAQGLNAGPFTETQATAGALAFSANCAPCHQDDLSGSGEAPALAGRIFAASWAPQSTRDLFKKIKLSMPLGAPNSLPDDTYASIVAFIMKANGASAGNAPLTPDTDVHLGTVWTGRPSTNAGQQAASASAAGAAQSSNAAAAPGAARPAGRGGRARGPAPLRTGLIVDHVVPQYSPVTEAMMANPPSSDWLMHYRNYAGWSFSPLKQINAANVGNLQLRWVLALDEGERQQITPLVHDGVMFVSANRTNTVQALDARTGEIVWENHIGPDLDFQLNATRTMGLYGDKVFYPATNAKLYALDAKTGKIDWQIQISDFGKDKIGGLTIADGKVIVGLTRCDTHDVRDRCFIAAYDPNDGHLIWKFDTVAHDGDPVGGKSWGKTPDADRAGNESWLPGTYDPNLNLVYFGTGQAKGLPPDVLADGLFQNSTIALDGNTGALKWYFQSAPDLSLDLDEVYEKTLVDEGDQKNLITVGKKGIMWKLDRVTGKFLDYRQTVFQNVYTAINQKTGRATYRPDILAQKEGSVVSSCPSQEGGHDWPNTSYDPDNGIIYLPLSQTCVINAAGQKFYEMPGTDGNLGRISAYDAKTFKPVWSFQQRTPFLTGVVTTAGGVGFVGDWDRVVRAFDLKTGKTLWQSRLGTTVQGYITTFSVGDEQFVAVPTGYNGGSPEQKPTTMLTGELNRPATGHAVYVFALPQSH